MIILTQGLQGSGKTTWSKAWVEEFPKGRIRVNRDDIRRMLGPYWIPTREHIVTDIVDAAVKSAIEEDYDVVIDNMNLSLTEVNKWTSLANQFKVPLTFQPFLDVPLSVCIERDKNREHPIGEEVIRRTYIKYSHLFEKE